MNGRITLCESLPPNNKLTRLEEKVLARYILDMDKKEFALRLTGVENTVNYILELRESQRVGKTWAY